MPGVGFVDAVSTVPLDDKTAWQEGFVDVSRLDDVPAPWREAMEKAGTYSRRQLADKAGTGTSTVSDLIYGRKLTSEPTLQAVADALRLPVTTVRGWAAAARGEHKPFELPPEANRLGRRQREAVLAVVRAMLDTGEKPTIEDVRGAGAGGPLAQPVDINSRKRSQAADRPAARKTHGEEAPGEEGGDEKARDEEDD